MAMATKPSGPPGRKRPFRYYWRRFGWPVLRQLIIPMVCVLALVIGMAAGYSVLGKRPMSEVWDWAIWKHMYDLVFSDSQG